MIAPMDLTTVSAATAAFLSHRTVKGLTKHSIDRYTAWLTLWRTWLGSNQRPLNVLDLSADDFRLFLLYLEKEHIPHGTNPRRKAAQRVGMAPASRHSAWRTLRAWWRFLLQEGALHENQVNYFTGGRVPAPQIPEGPRPIYRESDLDALLAACVHPSPEQEWRDKTLLLILYESGARIFEICTLEDTQIDQVRCQADIQGKGGRQRWIYWSDETAAALRKYLGYRRGKEGGPLFRGFGSKNDGEAITPNLVRGMIKRRAKKAKVDLIPQAQVHGWRRTFAQRALDDGVDVLDLQQLMGHASPETTAIYARRSPSRLRRVYRRIQHRRKHDDE